MEKVILITGTSSGLGRLTARYFAEKGWHVAATMRSPEKETTLREIPGISVFKLDLTKKETVADALKAVFDKFGRIDVVVNNAGKGIYGALELTEESDIDEQFAVNFRGILHVIRCTLPYFRRQNSGKIINISSLMGRTAALPLGSLYNMSKFALEGLTEGLYFELKPLNIDLHLIEPGGFESGFGANLRFINTDKEDYRIITERVAAQLRAAQLPGATNDPRAIADVIYKLATNKSKAFRTVVGKDARVVLLLRKLLPVRTFLNLLGSRFTR